MRRAPLLCARSKCARQRLCRAYSCHCRAPPAHGKARESGSDYSVHSENENVRRHKPSDFNLVYGKMHIHVPTTSN
jgi:hypothetical protein